MGRKLYEDYLKMNTCCIPRDYKFIIPGIPLIPLHVNTELFDAVKNDDYKKVKDIIQNDENVIKNRFWDLCDNTFEEEKWLPTLPWNVAVLNGSHKVLELIYNKLDSLHEKEIIHMKENKYELNAIQLLITVADKNLRSEDDCVKTFDFLVSLCEKDVADYLMDVDSDDGNCLQMACQYQTLQLMMKIFQFEGVYKFTPKNMNASNLTKEFYDISDFKDINPAFKVVSPLDCIHWIKKEKLKEADKLVQHEPLKPWVEIIFKDNKCNIELWIFSRVMRVIFFFVSMICLFPSYSADIHLIHPLKKRGLSSLLIAIIFYGLIKCLWLLPTFIKYFLFVKSNKRNQYMGFFYICDCFMYAGLLIFLIGTLIKRNESLDLCKVGLLIICLTAPWHVLNCFRISISFGSYRYIMAIQKMIMVAGRFIPILLIIFIPFVICFKLVFHIDHLDNISLQKAIHHKHRCINGFVKINNNINLSLPSGDIVISNDEINISSDQFNLTANMTSGCEPFNSWIGSAYHSWLMMLGIADMQSYDISHKYLISLVLHVLFSIVMSLMVLNFVTALFVNAYVGLDESRHVIAASQNLDVIRTLKEYPPKVFILSHIFCCKKSRFITLQPGGNNFFEKSYISDDRPRTYLTYNVLRKKYSSARENDTRV